MLVLGLIVGSLAACLLAALKPAEELAFIATLVASTSLTAALSIMLYSVVIYGTIRWVIDIRQNNHVARWYNGGNMPLVIGLWFALAVILKLGAHNSVLADAMFDPLVAMLSLV